MVLFQNRNDMNIKRINCVLRFKETNDILNDCYITISPSEYWLNIPGHLKMLSKMAPVWNDTLHYMFVDAFEVVSATIDDKSIFLNLENSKIVSNDSMSNRTRIRLDTISCSTELNHAYLLSPSSKSMKWQFVNGQFITTYDNICFIFTYDSVYETVKVVTSEKNSLKVENSLTSLLMLISFYLRIPIEIWQKELYDEHKEEKQFSMLKYNSVMELKEGNNIDYIIVNDSFLGLSDFLRGIHYLQLDGFKREIVNRGIERYIVSKYLDKITRFVYLVSIIHTFAEKVYEQRGTNASDSVNKLLEKFSIDKDIINENVEFKSIRNGKIGKHFVEVRNEILHALPSQEIEMLIENTELVRKVDFCAFILIMHELGFSDIKFDENFMNLNILKV